MRKVASNQSEETRDGMITQMHSLMMICERRPSHASSEEEDVFSSCPSYESSVEEPSKEEEAELGQPPYAPRPNL